MLFNFFPGLYPGYEGLLLSFQIYFILPILSKKKKKLAPSFKRFEYFNIIQEYWVQEFNSERMRGTSSFTCKELGSHHSILRSKQLNKLKNQQLFLDPWERWGHRANHFPQNWRNRLANTGVTAYLSRKPQKPVSK